MHATYDSPSPTFADPSTVDFSSWEPVKNVGWTAAGLTAEELGRMVRSNAECDEVIETLTDGWNQPSPDLFQYFRHTYNAIENIEDTLDHERRTVERLFKELKRGGIEAKLSDFINRKRWYPNVDRQTDSYLTGPAQPTTTATTTDDTEPTPTPVSKKANCWHCRQKGHHKNTCPVRYTTQRRR